MEKYDIVIIGCGPAGISAAIEGAKAGGKVLIIDENSQPGGQLFKQIHKFFGSKGHRAGTRGYVIGKDLLDEAIKLGIDLWLNTEVCGISKDLEIWALRNKVESLYINPKRIIISTGAMENPLKFNGWTLPGVMGAGAAQTMVNIHRILPGQKILMVGSGNVGVIVSYQLLQAGAQVVGVLEAAPKLGGYGVHTAKIRRAGIPFYTAHSIQKAMGEKKVEAAEIVQLDSNWQPVSGTEKILNVDTICLATGLTPLAELAWIAGCQFEYIPKLGGHIPLHNTFMETSVEGVYVAGDISGIEEASTAMEEGKLAGVCCAASLGLYSEIEKNHRVKDIWARLDSLRCGQFGRDRKSSKDFIINKFREAENE